MQEQFSLKYYSHAETVLLSLENILNDNGGGDGFFIGAKVQTNLEQI